MATWYSWRLLTHVLLNRARRRARPCDVFLLLAICRWSVGVAFCVANLLAGSSCLALALLTLLALRAYTACMTACSGDACDTSCGDGMRAGTVYMI